MNRSYSYDEEDRLLTAGAASYAFDVDGFLTSKTEAGATTAYHYSSRGELKQVDLPGTGVITYSHDPLGRRIAKSVDGIVVERYQWLGRTRLLAVLNADFQELQPLGAVVSRLRDEDGSAGFPLGKTSHSHIVELRTQPQNVINQRFLKSKSRIPYKYFDRIDELKA